MRTAAHILIRAGSCRRYLYYDESPSSKSSTARIPDISSGSLYPVPLLLRNHRIDGVRYNVESDRGTSLYQLTRRFFTVDAASGVKTVGDLPLVLRYIKSAKLEATMRSERSTDGAYDPNRILPPLLTIEYDEVQIPDSATTPLDAEDKLASAGVVLTTSFEAIYTMQMNNTCAATLVNAECVAVQCVAADAVRSLKLNVRSNVTLNYLSVVTLVFWLIITIAKAVMLLRRNHASTVDSYVMLRWFLTACSVLASTFFFLLFAIAVYWTLTFKGQCVLRHSSRPPRPYERALSSLECSLSLLIISLWLAVLVQDDAVHDDAQA